ncbi:unnamed protein product, partial [Ectocarpus sp. 12 AP-2014]
YRHTHWCVCSRRVRRGLASKGSERGEADFQLIRATSFFWCWRGGWSTTAALPSPWMCQSFLLGPGRSRKSAARRRVATARGTPRKVLLIM